MDLLRALVQARGVTALVATHDPALLDLAHRVLTLRDGRLTEPESALSDAHGVAGFAIPLRRDGR